MPEPEGIGRGLLREGRKEAVSDFHILLYTFA